MNLSKVSQSFRNRADTAAFWEAWVGAVLSREGLYVLHYPFQADDGQDHGQTWDLDVCGENPYPSRAPVPTQVEVKSTNLTFTCPDDYPFPELLVCSQNSWLRKWPGRDYTMRDFLFVSRKTGAVLWLPQMTQVELGVEIEDRTRGEFYKAVRAKSQALKPLAEFTDYVKERSDYYP